MQQENSRQLVDAAVDHAKGLGIAINVAIADAGGNLMAFQRMDGAFLGSIDIALKKARTAVLFSTPTEELGELGELGELVREHRLDSFEQSNNGLILFAGGEPVQYEGLYIGGIGISGGSAAQDKEIARFAITQLKRTND